MPPKPKEFESAVLIFTLAPGTDPRNAADMFSQKNNVNVSNSTAMTVNGMNALKTVGVMSSGEQTIGIASYYIKMDDKVFAFHGLASQQEFGGYTAQFEASAHGFNRITDQSKIDVSPKKITVRKVQENTILKKAFNGFGVPEDELERLAVINGMELTDALEAGTRIKIVA